MTLTLEELNERTGFANKRDFVTSIYDYVAEHQELPAQQLKSIRDAYIIQGNFTIEHSEVFDEHNLRCEELDVKGKSVVDDTTLFPNIDTLDKFQSYVFDSAIAKKPIDDLLTPIYKQVLDYAKTEGSDYSIVATHLYNDEDTKKYKHDYNDTFNIIDPSKLKVSQEIKDLFPAYEVSENDAQKLVDYKNNNVIIINTEGFESNESAITGIPKQALLDNMNDTQNSIAIATHLIETSPDISIELNLTPEQVRNAINADRADVWEYARPRQSGTKYYVHENNQFADGLSDLSEHAEPQL